MNAFYRFKDRTLSCQNRLDSVTERKKLVPDFICHRRIADRDYYDITNVIERNGLVANRSLARNSFGCVFITDRLVNIDHRRNTIAPDLDRKLGRQRFAAVGRHARLP